MTGTTAAEKRWRLQQLGSKTAMTGEVKFKKAITINQQQK